MKYFRKEENPQVSLPKNFVSGFLEVSYETTFEERRMLIVYDQGRN